MNRRYWSAEDFFGGAWVASAFWDENSHFNEVYLTGIWGKACNPSQ